MTKTITESIHESRDAIASVTVYHLGTLLSTFSALSPAALESHPLTRTFHESGADDVDRLVTVATSLDLGEPTDDIDARWGIVFASSGGERIAAIYINEFGSKASDGERCFAVTGADHAMETLRDAYGPDGVLE